MLAFHLGPLSLAKLVVLFLSLNLFLAKDPFGISYIKERVSHILCPVYLFSSTK